MMMTFYLFPAGWRSAGALSLPGVLLSPVIFTVPALAQIEPDMTLGEETSVVVPDTEVQGEPAASIEGGAIRGSNLFHSFQEFNVLEGQQVYFTNPDGITSILSRITGGNPSNIFGTLGVDGTANLFLLNPNGIVFGENAALAIEGSFYASTAEAISLGNEIYSATQPEQSNLLTVNPSALFSSYLTNASGDIENKGQLLAGDNLALVANNLDLQGQIAAGGNLTLLATNQVQIHDAAHVPFIGFAGGDLLIQGNEQVNILALSHASSGLYAHGNMTLRSANRVGGDAHYWSGGDFRVENLNGEVGQLFSPIDPIIRTLGDVDIEGYEGSSLHILAGGSVTIGTAIITNADSGRTGFDFLQETIDLSDGTVVEVNGSAQPTLDVRAGVTPEAIGIIPLDNLSGYDPIVDMFVTSENGQFLFVDRPNILETPSSANISVGDIWINAPNGLVLLTNRYQPSSEIPDDSISVTGEGIFGDGIYTARFEEQSGSVYIDSRGDISVTNSYIDTTGTGEVGDIVLLAADRVSFSGQNDFALGAFSGVTAFGEGTGGDVRIRATQLDLLNGAELSTSNFGSGNAGSIVLDISDSVLLDGINSNNDLPGGISSRMGAFSSGTAGDIWINAAQIEVTNGARLNATNAGPGNAGNIILVIRGNARFDGSVVKDGFSTASGIFSNSSLFEQDGAGGNVRIDATNLEVTDGARLDVSSFGNGQGGSLILEIRETARFDGVDATGNNASGGFSNFIGDRGRGGNIQLNAANLEVSNGAKLDVTGSGAGEAGSIILDITETARFDGVNPIRNLQFSGAFSNFISTAGTGKGGDIQISATNLDVTNGAQIDGSIFGGGEGGDILLNISETARFDGVSPLLNRFASGVYSRNQGGNGVGGDVRIGANNLHVTNGALIDASSFGIGDGGNIFLRVYDRARFSGSGPTINQLPSGVFSRVTLEEGTGGDIQLEANTLEVLDGASLSTENLGSGNAGNMMLTLQNQLSATDGTIATNAQSGSGGQITISARDMLLSGDSDIRSFVQRGTGGGGNISLTADLIIAFDDSDILAFSADGVGGNILLNTPAFFGENFQAAPQISRLEALIALDGNSQVDVNATGAIASGTITLPDISFIEDSLTELEETTLDTATLTAGSCIARTENNQGSFIVTGRDGLPLRPGDHTISTYPTGTVQTVSETNAVQEPDGVYQLPDGRLVLSRECPDH